MPSLEQGHNCYGTQSKSRNRVPFLDDSVICVIHSIGSIKEHCAGVRTLTGLFPLVLCEQDGSIYTKAYLTCYVHWYKKESQRLVSSWEPPSRFSARTRTSRGMMSACQSKKDNKELKFQRATILYVLLASGRTRTEGQNGCSQIRKFEWRAFWPLTTKPLASQKGHWTCLPLTCHLTTVFILLSDLQDAHVPFVNVCKCIILLQLIQLTLMSWLGRLGNHTK